MRRNNETALSYVFVFFINVALYFFFQVIGSLLQFVFFGSGNISEQSTKGVALFLVIGQALALIALFKKKRFIYNIYFLIINLLVLFALYGYYILYLTSTFD
jgi:hypothetical protein